MPRALVWLCRLVFCALSVFWACEQPPVDLDERATAEPDMVSAASPGADAGDWLDAQSGDAADPAAVPTPGPLQAAFARDIEPRLSVCFGCHEAAPLNLLAPPDRLASLLGYRGGALLDCEAPARSRFVTIGAHAGAPAFSPQDGAMIVAFIAEWSRTASPCAPADSVDAADPVDAAPDAAHSDAAAPPPFQDGLIVTPPLRAVMNANSWDLSSLAPGITGTRLTFEAQFVEGGLHLTDLILHAGPAGVRARSPSIESCQFGRVVLAPAEAFADVDVVIPPGAQASLGGGVVTLRDVSPGTALALRFGALGPAGGPAGPPNDLGGACADSGQ
ncbi:hypothetical protein L6V77_18100 [Myxococcota bacterium]|nr:hypothetical protein [Myxococcota bacterium]